MNAEINRAFAEILAAVEVLEEIPVRAAAAEEIQPEEGAFIVVSSAPAIRDCGPIYISDMRILLSVPAFAQEAGVSLFAVYQSASEAMFAALRDHEAIAAAFNSARLVLVGSFFLSSGEDAADNRWIWEGNLRVCVRVI
jgi:hypothetical protein